MDSSKPSQSAVTEHGDTRLSTRLLRAADWAYHHIEQFWEHARTQRTLATILVTLFLIDLFLITLNRAGWLPEPLASAVPRNHFYAVSLVFTCLLILEIIGFVFTLVGSTADSVGKQFEILSLILLRQSFDEFVNFDEPIRWQQISETFFHIISDAGGAALIFVILAFYYRIQKHNPITGDKARRARFVSTKKALALFLFLSFIVLGAYHFHSHIGEDEAHHFFDSFFTILIFSDILLILISLRYKLSYQMVFRNSGFTLATVIIRLALTAPPYINVALGLGAIVFTVALVAAFNLFLQDNAADAKHHTEEA
jgi:hypothetical protein